jgi:hypothetical protein
VTPEISVDPSVVMAGLVPPIHVFMLARVSEGRSYKNINGDDRDAIVAYLRTLKAK